MVSGEAALGRRNCTKCHSTAGANREDLCKLRHDWRIAVPKILVSRGRQRAYPLTMHAGALATSCWTLRLSQFTSATCFFFESLGSLRSLLLFRKVALHLTFDAQRHVTPATPPPVLHSASFNHEMLRSLLGRCAALADKVTCNLRVRYRAATWISTDTSSRS